MLRPIPGAKPSKAGKGIAGWSGAVRMMQDMSSKMSMTKTQDKMTPVNKVSKKMPSNGRIE